MSEQWQVAVVPNKAGKSTIESFAHWHCGVEGVRQETVVPMSELTAAQQRVAELEKLCTMDGIEDLIETRERLTAENAELRRLVDRHDRDYMAVQQKVDRQRELLLECVEWLDYVSLVDRINAELAKGE